MQCVAGACENVQRLHQQARWVGRDMAAQPAACNEHAGTLGSSRSACQRASSGFAAAAPAAGLWCQAAACAMSQPRCCVEGCQATHA